MTTGVNSQLIKLNQAFRILTRPLGCNVKGCWAEFGVDSLFVVLQGRIPFSYSPLLLLSRSQFLFCFLGCIISLSRHDCWFSTWGKMSTTEPGEWRFFDEARVCVLLNVSWS